MLSLLAVIFIPASIVTTCAAACDRAQGVARSIARSLASPHGLFTSRASAADVEEGIVMNPLPATRGDTRGGYAQLSTDTGGESGKNSPAKDQVLL